MLNKLKEIIQNGNIGFQMDEVMTGHHEFEQGLGLDGVHPFEFKVTWGPNNIFKWSNPFNEEFLLQPLEGTITVGGLCRDAKCKGTLELSYFKERKIRYKFDFEINKRVYRFIGEKVNIWPWNLLVSHTTCFGTLVEKDTGKLISRSVTFFKLWRSPAFLASLRLT